MRNYELCLFLTLLLEKHTKKRVKNVFDLVIFHNLKIEGLKASWTLENLDMLGEYY